MKGLVQNQGRVPPQGSLFLPDAILHQLMMRERSRLRASGVNPDEFLTPKIGKGVLLARSQRDIANICHKVGGRAKRPGILAMEGPSGTVTFMPGMGVTDAAELQDLMFRTWEREQENIRIWGQAIPFRKYWERQGLPQTENFSDIFKQALEDRIKRHKANMRTDPPRRPGLPLRGYITVARSISGIKREKSQRLAERQTALAGAN